MAGQLRDVAMRRPGAILSADPEVWHYAKPIDADALSAQFDAFASLLKAQGARIHWLDSDAGDGLADSVFTYDPSFVIPAGAVILRAPVAARNEDSLARFRTQGYRTLQVVFQKSLEDL